MKRNWTTDDYMYAAGLVIVLVGVAALLLWRCFFAGASFAPCVFYTSWGVYCPGCGGTRAILALLEGRLLAALYYHPFVVLLPLWGGAYLTSQSIWRLRGRRGAVLRYRDSWLVILGIGLLANCLLRNALLFGFQIYI